MSETEKKLTKKFENSTAFLPYIREIRFPMYKSLEADLKIQFHWPITALIGPNGTNKSSVLQAISAAPEGRSLASFWFSTEVDDIDSGPRGKIDHRFVYTYSFDSSDQLAECRKYRGSKKYRSVDVPASLRNKRDPDYWEPTKRVAKDGMEEIPASGFIEMLSKNRDRWNQIDKSVVYLDFRSELSAFDKFIHHHPFDRWAKDDSQKRYRAVLRSKWIARALDGHALPHSQADKIIGPMRLLDEDSTNSIAAVLGKPIEQVFIIQHRFYGPAGFTVRMKLAVSGATYSEAHAGSGEYAVVRLVDAFKNAAPSSLILLDEPEVSLHPGAQHRLMQFIETETLRHGHQVVISTHSPALVAGLPHKAIKVFGFEQSSQRVVLLADHCSPTEAFTHLGHAITGDGARLFVEDDLASEFVRAALRRHGPKKLAALEIIPFPGGADGIVRNVLSTLALANIKKAGVLIDGDQRPASHEANLDLTAATAQADTVNAAGQLWRKQFHKTEPFLHSDSDHGRDLQTIKTCTDWASHHLGWLPGEIPEQTLAVADGVVDPGWNSTEWKQYWVDRTRETLHLTEDEVVTADSIFAVQKAVLASLPGESDLLVRVFDEVDRIIDW